MDSHTNNWNNILSECVVKKKKKKKKKKIGTETYYSIIIKLFH